MESKKLSVYVKRGKAIQTGELFDDTIPENAHFITHWSEKLGGQAADEKATASNGKKGKEPKSTGPAPLSIMHELDKKKKELESQKLQQEVLKLEMDLAKKAGQVIPTELVKSLFAQTFKGFTVAFKHAVDNILIEISKRKKFSNEEMAEYRGRLVQKINEAVDKGVVDSQKNITNVVNEYTERRKQGERG